MKFDLKTAEWLVDKAQNDRSVFPVEFEECKICGALYLPELGHNCNDTVIEVASHEYYDGENHDASISGQKERASNERP